MHQPSPRTLRRWRDLANLAAVNITAAADLLDSDEPELAAIEADLIEADKAMLATLEAVHRYRVAQYLKGVAHEHE